MRLPVGSFSRPPFVWMFAISVHQVHFSTQRERYSLLALIWNLLPGGGKRRYCINFHATFRPKQEMSFTNKLISRQENICPYISAESIVVICVFKYGWGLVARYGNPTGGNFIVSNNSWIFVNYIITSARGYSL